MSKLSEKFLYYPLVKDGVLKAFLPFWVPISEPTDSAFFMASRGAPAEPTGTTFNLKER